VAARVEQGRAGRAQRLAPSAPEGFAPVWSTPPTRERGQSLWRWRGPTPHTGPRGWSSATPYPTRGSGPSAAFAGVLAGPRRATARTARRPNAPRTNPCRTDTAWRRGSGAAPAAKYPGATAADTRRGRGGGTHEGSEVCRVLGNVRVHCSVHLKWRNSLSCV
jgi:hypothetical protein